MKIDESQIRGMAVLIFVLAAVPLIFFGINRRFPDVSPAMSSQQPDSVAVEVAGPSSQAGVYFVSPRTGIREFLKSLHVRGALPQDFPLQQGMKIILPDSERAEGVVIDQMDAGTKLALELPVDINRASAEDLMMVRGIGEKMACRILELRARKGKFRNLEELMEIPGIKEKRLARLKKYLCVETP